MIGNRLTRLCWWFDTSLNWLFLLACTATYIAAPTTEKLYGWHADATQRGTAVLIFVSALRLLASHIGLRNMTVWKITWSVLTIAFLAFEIYSGTTTLFRLVIEGEFDSSDLMLTLFIITMNLPSCALLIMLIMHEKKAFSIRQTPNMD